MALLYIGGELAQSRLGLPAALTGVMQGTWLFALLACEALARVRVRWREVARAGGDGTVVALAAATLNAGTPLLLAAIGVLVCERSGW